MRFAVVVFPGSNCDHDAHHALASVLGQEVELVWHKATDLGGADVVVLPGGFSYGDYLRCGAIARFSPVMTRVKEFAAAGGPVIGICNGFQVLLEAGLLPGGMRRNRDLKFICEHVHLRVESADTPVTCSAVAGRRAIMEQLMDGVAFGGTYNGNPIVMAAGLATLRTMTDAAYGDIHERTSRLGDGLRRVFSDAGVPGCVVTAGSLFQLYFLAEAPRNYREAARDDGARQRWLYFWLMNHGIVTRRGGNVSLPMTDHHVDRLVEEVGNALRHLP